MPHDDTVVLTRWEPSLTYNSDAFASTSPSPNHCVVGNRFCTEMYNVQKKRLWHCTLSCSQIKNKFHQFKQFFPFISYNTVFNSSCYFSGGCNWLDPQIKRKQNEKKSPPHHINRLQMKKKKPTVNFKIALNQYYPDPSEQPVYVGFLLWSF